jgi:hypothetical protein
MEGKQPLGTGSEEEEFAGVEPLPTGDMPTFKDRQLAKRVEERLEADKAKQALRQKRKITRSKPVEAEDPPKPKKLRKLSKLRNPAYDKLLEDYHSGKIDAKEYRRQRWNIWNNTKKGKKTQPKEQAHEEEEEDGIIEALSKTNFRPSTPKQPVADARIELNGASVSIICPYDEEKLEFAINSLAFLRQRLREEKKR